jgi:predicted small secreted protein
MRTLFQLIVVAAAFAASACNTVRGAATDVNSAANTVENAMH